MRSDLRVFEYAHNGPVTCMVVHESHHHQYLLSGGKDGAVKIWNLEQVSRSYSMYRSKALTFSSQGWKICCIVYRTCSACRVIH